jgi:hypothetical protein
LVIAEMLQVEGGLPNLPVSYRRSQRTPAAGNPFEARGAKLRQVRAVQARALDVLSSLEERRKQTDGIEDLKGARLDRRGPRLSMASDLPLDQPHPYAVASEFTGSEQPRRTGAHNQDVVLRHELRTLLKSVEVLKTQTAA